MRKISDSRSWIVLRLAIVVKITSIAENSDAIDLSFRFDVQTSVKNVKNVQSCQI